MPIKQIFRVGIDYMPAAVALFRPWQVNLCTKYGFSNLSSCRFDLILGVEC